MSLYVLAFLIGVVAGLRALTAPAAVSWAARLGWLHLNNTPLGFLGFAATPYIVSVLALAELIGDTPKVAFDHYGREWGQHYQDPLWNAIGVRSKTTAVPSPTVSKAKVKKAKREQGPGGKKRPAVVKRTATARANAQ